MSSRPGRGPSPDEPAKTGLRPSDDPGAGPAGHHDETGLDLARSVARSLSAQRRDRPRRASPAAAPDGQDRAPARGEPRWSGAHPDERDPQPLDATLGRLVADEGWDSEVRVHGVFSRWDAIVGREVAAHVRPVHFERAEGEAGGRVVVEADSTAWATQMRLLAGTVVRRLNEVLGQGTVAVIDVRGPSAPSWVKGRFRVRGGRGPRDTYG